MMLRIMLIFDTTHQFRLCGIFLWMTRPLNLITSKFDLSADSCCKYSIHQIYNLTIAKRCLHFCHNENFFWIYYYYIYGNKHIGCHYTFLIFNVKIMMMEIMMMSLYIPKPLLYFLNECLIGLNSLLILVIVLYREGCKRGLIRGC